MSRELHMTLQGKGGVGKTFIAALVVQTLYGQLQEGEQVLLLDTDPINERSSASQLFSRFADRGGFACRRLLLSDQRSLSVGDFQQVIDLIAAHDGPCVVDVGTSVYDPLLKFLTGSGEGLAQISEDLQRPLCIHMPLCGGGDFADTLGCFQRLYASEDFACARFTAWINPQLHGAVFTGADTPQRHGLIPSPRLNVIELPEVERSTQGVALQKMSRSQLIFWDFEPGHIAAHGRPCIEGREALSHEVRWCRRAAGIYRDAIAAGWAA